MISDKYLTILAAAFEVGLPLSLCFLYIRTPKLRPRIVVLLGALSPFFLFYAVVVARFLFTAPGKESAWAFSAVWLMTLIPYLACLLAGAILCFAPRPTRLWTRYFLGLSSVLAIGLLLSTL